MRGKGDLHQNLYLVDQKDHGDLHLGVTNKKLVGQNLRLWWIIWSWFLLVLILDLKVSLGPGYKTCCHQDLISFPRNPRTLLVPKHFSISITKSHLLLLAY